MVAQARCFLSSFPLFDPRFNRIFQPPPFFFLICKLPGRSVSHPRLPLHFVDAPCPHRWNGIILPMKNKSPLPLSVLNIDSATLMIPMVRSPSFCGDSTAILVTLPLSYPALICSPEMGFPSPLRPRSNFLTPGAGLFRDFFSLPKCSPASYQAVLSLLSCQNLPILIGAPCPAMETQSPSHPLSTPPATPPEPPAKFFPSSCRH